ncbi:hydrolase [Alicycliphilus denitrificans]|uniref:M20 aminoacylase family protein n=1 Tax=Alicycliphilus denitrificans TaxID=179636 RepID=UPI00095C0F4C|nr:M20 aminoacylase family protein [Alicycliphilus denitrificans]MBN9572317.1 amidohydrolase [Alicycliphilus denitrificans]OJW87131.1 MAG: amidohydrolase [Alicycliphilus sp. 69-12]BCN37922.1 hydrolase [Alicycliphilus denitrificans]
MYLDQDAGLRINQLTAFRRDLHMHPELKYEERRTADKVAAYLAALGIPMARGLGGTGIVASIHGEGRGADDPGPAVGIRADMDALPLQETNRFAHASRHEGRMHACGHDGHMAMALGAAELLAADRNFDGTVHLIFQPAEEGGAGARAMMDDGLFTRFPCQAVFALHNWPALPQGQMGVRVGPIMAAARMFEIIVRGRGGHAALPHTTIDPIPVACAIVGQLQVLVSRGTDPLDSAVLTVGRIESGTSANIIPDEARIQGTCRNLTTASQQFLMDGLHRISSHIAEAHCATAQVVFKPGGYPATDNHRKEALFMGEVMRELVGDDNAHTDVLPAMTAEDFGFMLQEVPGAYGWIGNGAGGKPGVGLHNPGYDFNDDNLALGARFWDRLARRWFETQAQR